MNKWIDRILWIIAIALAIFQAILAAYYIIPEKVCFLALNDAARVFEGGGFVIASPIMSLWGLLARAFGVTPIYLTRNILPFLIIPLCYLSYAFLTVTISKERIKTPAILIFIELLNIYGYQSEALAKVALLLGYFRGESLIVHLVLPLLLAVYIRWRRKHPFKEIQKDEAVSEDDMKNKFINVKNLSIAFIVFVVVVIGAILILNRKINNLHDATVNLQDVIENKGEYIEFKGALGEDSCGYILVDKDDDITVIFGGKYEDGEALLEVISEYGNHVTTWYLSDEGEQGAFEYCREQGTVIDHVITIGGLEEL